MFLRMDSRLPQTALLAVLAGLSMGCSMFQPRLSPELNAQVTPKGVEDGKVPPPPGSFTVEVQPAKGKPIAKEQPLVGPLTVQEALEHTKANQRFSKFNLELHRNLPDGRMHKMVLKYDRQKKLVDPEFDYTILAGDRLIVVQDTTTILDEALDAMTIPFGGPTRKKGNNGPGVHYRTEG
jgi:hypothetical protein